MKKINRERAVSIVLWIMMIILGADIVIKGLKIDERTWEKILRNVQQQAIEAYLPSIVEENQGETVASWILKQIETQLPGFRSYVSQDRDNNVEDVDTSRKIVEENTEFLEAKLLEENQEAGPPESGYENTGGVDAQSGQEKKEQETAANIQEKAPVTDIPMEKFQDFDFVMRSFYTVDKTTSMSGEQLNAPELVQMDMRMQAGKDQPQILIFHSHSQEEFIDSIPGDPSTSIVGVGAYLTSLLKDTYHYNVIHVTDTFDIVDGKLDRNKAYTFAQERISQILEENPSVEVVIDLHRDGVPEDKRLVTNINGKDTAKIMFFNGLSRTNKNGEISYLPNPYIRENLAFSLQMMLEAKKYYPDLARTIYLRGYRYNLHLRPKTLLVECGAQTNTVQEEMNAMEPLADILNKVLTGT